MATKFIQLDEAAELLGISSDELNEIRGRNEIRGFRDGATWKFKSDDVDALAEKIKSEGGLEAVASEEAPSDEPELSLEDSNIQLEEDSSEESALNLGDEPTDAGDESVLISERELGGSDVTGASTIIGESAEPDTSDSDITLADEAAAGSDVELVGDSMLRGSDVGLADSDIQLESGAAEEAPEDQAADEEVAASEEAAADTDVTEAAADTEVTETVADLGDTAGGSDLSLEFDDLESLDLTLDEEPTGAKATGGEELAVDAGSDLSLTSESGLELDAGDELTLGEAEGSGAPLEADGSSIDLTEDDDDDLVLGGSGTDSDITIGAGDSGISLMDPADSGLSLEEEPATLELGGSAAGDDSLVLGEDDMISLGEDLSGDDDSPTQLKSDDDFLLTPLEEADDLSESGSQVIALDEAGGGFSESAATMLQVEGDAGMGLLEEDLTDADTMVGGPGMAAGAAAIAATPQMAPGAVMQPAIPEAPYSIWNVLSLFACIMVLCLTGMLVYDVVRQMWSWQGTYPVNSGLMQAIIDIFK